MLLIINSEIYSEVTIIPNCVLSLISIQREVVVLPSLTLLLSQLFAFVVMYREEADKAIAAFNGYALNHLILSLSYAEKKKSTGPRFSTGYGRALPQNVRK